MCILVQSYGQVREEYMICSVGTIACDPTNGLLSWRLGCQVSLIRRMVLHCHSTHLGSSLLWFDPDDNRNGPRMNMGIY
jgi:hypothetical protein